MTSSESLRSRLEEISQFAHDASSMFGSQPYTLVVTDSSIELHALLEARSRRTDLDGRESLIASGSALYLLKLALRCNHVQPEVEFTPNSRQPGLLARLRITGKALPSVEENELFSILTTDPAKRGRADLGRTAPGFHPIKRAASEEGINLRYVEGGLLRSMTVDMLQVDDRLMYQSAAQCSDFRHWLGIAGLFVSSPSEMVRWTVTADELRQARIAHLPLTDGDFAVFCTRRDDEANWIKTGMALGHVRLGAIATGMATAVFNQPLQVPGMRARFARETGFCCFPQVILRITNACERQESGGREYETSGVGAR